MGTSAHVLEAQVIIYWTMKDGGWTLIQQKIKGNVLFGVRCGGVSLLFNYPNNYKYQISTRNIIIYHLIIIFYKIYYFIMFSLVSLIDQLID